MPQSSRDTTALLALVRYLLPSSTASTLTQPTDLIAALVHAIQISLQFRLDQPSDALNDVPAGDEPRGGSSRDDDDTFSETATAVGDDQDAPTTLPTEQGFASLGVTLEDAERSRLKEGWNARGEDSYTFKYRHAQSQMAFTIKIGRIGNRVSIMGMAEDGEPHQFSLLLSDYVQSSFLPWPREDEPSSRQRPLNEGFNSEAKLQDLIKQFTGEIVLKLVPGIQVSGLTDTIHPSNPPPRGGPFPVPSQPRFPEQPSSSRTPYNPSIGHRDLDPTAAFQPPGLGRGRFDPSHDGGGMLVDFNHPLFAGRRGDDYAGPGGMMNPPGARWDPVGPGFSTGPDRGGSGLGGRPGSGNIGDGSTGLRDPDFDELLPPGEHGPDLRMPGQRGAGRGGFGRGGMGMDPFGGMGGGFGQGRGGFGGGGFGGGGLGGGGFFM